VSAIALERQLTRLVQCTPWLMDALKAVRNVGVPQGHIGAGAIRDTVWDALFGQQGVARSSDVDVVYFDARTEEKDWAEALTRELPGIGWEATNQATVHLWQSEALGLSVEPYSSVESALACWPETATAIALRLLEDGQLEVLAPCGLADLFDGIVRRNRGTPDTRAFAERVRTKQWRLRWPALRILET
jgi:uncharacterized protein